MHALGPRNPASKHLVQQAALADSAPKPHFHRDPLMISTLPHRTNIDPTTLDMTDRPHGIEDTRSPTDSDPDSTAQLTLIR